MNRFEDFPQTTQSRPVPRYASDPMDRAASIIQRGTTELAEPYFKVNEDMDLIPKNSVNS
jgi:hypothetical protein